MASSFQRQIDGEGATFGAGGFVASLVIGIAIEPFRATIGLENVVLIYLLVVVVAAALGGRTAGLFAAVSAALSYDFFLTTPYHTLAIDSTAQVITVGLLLTTGLVASFAGRARRRLTLAADEQERLLQLLNTITATTAAGGDVDQVAAEGIHQLLDARQVVIDRPTSDGKTVVEVGEHDLPIDTNDVLRLDGQGHITRPRAAGAGVVRWNLRGRGVVVDLVRRRRLVGTLRVIFDDRTPVSQVTRLALATIAHALAAVPVSSVHRSGA